MTNKQMETIANGALSAMAKKVQAEFDNRTIQAPANKNAIKAYRTKWQKKLNDKLAYIERKDFAGYYKDKPEEYKKDCEDAYYARFILRIPDEDWVKYLEG